jgi:hypothetical protein
MKFLPLLWFQGQSPDELDRPLSPVAQRVVFPDAYRLDQHPALYGPARDVELEVPVQQEADAAEPLLLLDVLAPGQSLPNAPGHGLAEGHR